MDQPAYELHGWTYYFLPGIDGFGLDPSHGIFTGNTHFAIASSAYHKALCLFQEVFGNASSQLTTQL
jgi:transglutaminase-like putative cysteine protease